MADAHVNARRRPARRRLVLALITIGLTIGVLSAGLLAVDVYLHQKLGRQMGYNVWGYRGPLSGRKVPNELRVAVLGGSTAFGYGVTWSEAFPARLEAGLRMRRPPASVVNLAYNNMGAYSFRATLEDYQYLEYDIVCLYEGYNDLGGHNTLLFRRDSAMFRLTGYLPIFQIAFREKAAALMYGDVRALYDVKERTVFRPTIAQRAAGGTLEAVGRISESLDRQISRMNPVPGERSSDAGTGCDERWRAYCEDMYRGVDYALALHKRVIVVTQPYIHAVHVDQQTNLAAGLDRRYGTNPHVVYVNLGKAIDLSDKSLAFDGAHLTVKGNEIIAGQLVEPALMLAARP